MFYFNTRQDIKMNEIVNKLLLAGNKFLPDMHLRQLGLTKKVDLGNLQKKSGNLKRKNPKI